MLELIDGLNDLDGPFRGWLTIISFCLTPLWYRPPGAISMCEKKVGEKHTFTMNPKERPRRCPFFITVALNEPWCSSLEVVSAGNIVIDWRIWGGEPTSNIYLELVPWELRSASTTISINFRTNYETCLCHLQSLESQLTCMFRRIGCSIQVEHT